MRRSLIALALAGAIGCGQLARAQSNFLDIHPRAPGQYTPVTDSSATGLTIPSGATYAVVCAEGTNHRFTWDGQTTPTASVGTLLQQNSCMNLNGAKVLAAFKIISVTAGGSFTASFGQ